MEGDSPRKNVLAVDSKQEANDRRGFLKGAGMAAVAALVGEVIPFQANLPEGFVPVAAAADDSMLPGKDGLSLLNDRPINAETPPHLLDDDVTPTA